MINPLIVEGQVHGGLAQGIAQALYEEAVYDADGNLVTGTMVDYLVPSAAGPARVHHRPDRDPVDDQPARGQGRRRGRHDRVHAGGGQRGRRRGAPPRRARRPDALHAGAGLAGDQQRGSDGATGPPREPSRTAVRRPRRRPEVPSDPPGVRLRAAALGRRGGHRARPGRRGRQGARRRAEPAAAAAAAAGLPDRARRPRRRRRAARRPRGRRRAGHRRDDHPPRGHARPAGRRALPAAGPGHRHGGRPGGAAPRHLRRRARARRPGRRPAGGGAGAGRDVRHRRAGTGGARSRPREFFVRLPGDGPAAGRGAGRGPGAEARSGLGQRVREVQPGRAGLGDRRRGRAGPRATATRSPRPGSG